MEGIEIVFRNGVLERIILSRKDKPDLEIGAQHTRPDGAVVFSLTREEIEKAEEIG